MITSGLVVEGNVHAIIIGPLPTKAFPALSFRSRSFRLSHTLIPCGHGIRYRTKEALRSDHIDPMWVGSNQPAALDAGFGDLCILKTSIIVEPVARFGVSIYCKLPSNNPALLSSTLTIIPQSGHGQPPPADPDYLLVAGN